MDTTVKTPSFILRLAAMLYDGLVACAVLMLSTAIVLPLAKHDAFTPDDLLFKLYLWLVLLFFFSGFWARAGQTVGMRAWRLKIIKKDHQPLSFMLAIKRFVLASALNLFCGIGLLYALVNKERETLYDKLLSTQVVRYPKEHRG